MDLRSVLYLKSLKIFLSSDLDFQKLPSKFLSCYPSCCLPDLQQLGNFFSKMTRDKSVSFAIGIPHSMTLIATSTLARNYPQGGGLH